jgi:transposase
MPDEAPITRADLREALDRAVEAIAAEISATRQELSATMAREFTAVHARLDNTNNMLTLLQGASTITHTHIDRTDSINAARQAATDQVIANIRRRLEALEKKAS